VIPTPSAETPHPTDFEYLEYLRQEENGEASEQPRAAAEEDATTQPDQADAQAGSQADGFDPALVQQGQAFFEESCTLCHDAERATSKRQGYAGWLTTVRRMAAKEDADIPADQHFAIATYLASLNPAATAPGANGAAAAAADAAAALPPFTLNGTLSPVYRGTDTDVENKGFFPDVWVGIEWQQENNPVSARVMACTSCHGENNDGLGVELVEGSMTLDLAEWLTGCSREELGPGAMEAELKAGRFPVPFSSFYQRSHPGSLRTVSLPLMFNMGRRVGPIQPLQPVIPMPYADEGVDLHLRKALAGEWSATLDMYAVNGLQMGTPGIFFFSRSYRDNNSNLAFGGRGTIGNDVVRVGGSIASGELQDDLAPVQYYKMSGADISLRLGERFRANYEYAIRVSDTFPGAEGIVYGNVVEAELTIRDCPEALRIPKVSLLARYDTLEHRAFQGPMSTERFTWGVNTTLRGGSLLILNHEHWIFDERAHANIFGLRWTAAF
jgi:hypothetical protein